MRTRVLVLGLAVVVTIGLFLRRSTTPRRETVEPRAAADAPEPLAFTPAPAPAGAARVEVATSTDVPASAAVTRPARLFGTLTDADDGRPLAGLTLGVSAAQAAFEARTAVDGSFAFELAPGTWTFYLRPGPERVPCVESLELAPGEERDLSRALGNARPLCVQVWRTERGRLVPCDGAALWLMAGTSDDLLRTRWARLAGLAPVHTSVDGRAELPFSDFGAYVLVVEHEGFLTWSSTFDFSPFSSWTPFSSDGCLHLALTEIGATLRGRVLAPDGRLLAGALVGLCASDEAYTDEASAQEDTASDATELQLCRSEFPACTLSADDGSFALPLPRRVLESELPARLVVAPGRADQVHHLVHELSAAERRASRWLELRLPEAGELELCFVDPQGRPLDGVASLRDADGLGHAPAEPHSWLDLDPRGPGRRLLTRAGRVRLRHPGGSVRVGLSPAGRWDGREFELELPRGEGLREVQVVIPR